MWLLTGRTREGHGWDLEERFGRCNDVKEQPPLGFELWKMETETYHEEHPVASNVNPLGVERGPPSVASQRGEACASSDGGKDASVDQN